MEWTNWLGLAVTSFAASVLLTTNGFGFAVLAVPFFLLLAPPEEAIPIAIILSLAVSVVVLPGLRHGVDWRLWLRLTIGSLVGLPLGLAAFAYADPLAMRAAAGTVIAVFAAAQAYNHFRQRPPSLAMHPVGDLVAGAAAGAATGLIGMPGPPVVIYLIMVGAPTQLSRSTQIAFFALIFGATLGADEVLHGVPGADWAIAASLMPLAAAGAWIGIRIARRLDRDAAAILAIAVLALAGLYTLAAAARAALW